MRYNESKLEKWIGIIPECEEFLFNFFISATEDKVCELVNYINDIINYSKTNNPIRRNYNLLLKVYEEISGLRIYYG